MLARAWLVQVYTDLVKGCQIYARIPRTRKTGLFFPHTRKSGKEQQLLQGEAILAGALKRAMAKGFGLLLGKTPMRFSQPKKYAPFPRMRKRFWARFGLDLISHLMSVVCVFF